MEEIREQERRLEMQRQIIEEERQRLLRQHAPKLVGFLPKVRTQLMLSLCSQQLHFFCGRVKCVL